jgi:hypothetical protein
MLLELFSCGYGLIIISHFSDDPLTILQAKTAFFHVNLFLLSLVILSNTKEVNAQLSV